VGAGTASRPVAVRAVTLDGCLTPLYGGENGTTNRKHPLMTGKRSPGKKFIGWWAPEKLRDRLKTFTRSRSTTDTDALNRALQEFLDRHENGEDPK
jgi:hypothetical protein